MRESGRAKEGWRGTVKSVGTEKTDAASEDPQGESNLRRGRLKTEQRMQTEDGRVKTGEESLKTAPECGLRTY